MNELLEKSRINIRANIHASLPSQFPTHCVRVRTSAILFGESEGRQLAKVRLDSEFAVEEVVVEFAAERRQVASAVATGASWKTTGLSFLECIKGR